VVGREIITARFNKKENKIKKTAGSEKITFRSATKQTYFPEKKKTLINSEDSRKFHHTR